MANYYNYIQLAIMASVPVAASVILHLIGKNKFIKSLPDTLKQVFVGIVFGIIAIMGTEKGVLINGATMNARDAAPLCAGLIFGAPAGIISGLIGGIERWFAVYWGAGTYTRVACTIATSLCGIFAATLRNKLFENRIPSSVYGFISGGVIEVFHLALVFVTNVSDAKKAFTVVQACAVPMISAVAISVFLSVWLVNFIDRDEKTAKNKEQRISTLFQRGLLVLVIVAYLATSIFSYIMQNETSKADTVQLLTININDIKNDISQASNRNLLSITENIASFVEKEEISNELLTTLLSAYNVSEINVADENGKIIYSSNEEFVGFDFSSGEQSKEFLCLLNGSNEYVQEYGPISYDTSMYRKYAGKALEKGFIQVGYDAIHFQKDLDSQVEIVANNRHIGETGSLLVINSKMDIVSSLNGEMSGLNAIELGLIDSDAQNKKEYERYTANMNGEDVYYMFTSVEGYTIVSILPKEEADFTKDISIYLNSFMEILVYAGLFILTSFLVNGIIIKNLNKVDYSLRDITNGKLDTVVNVNQTREFRYLSKGINETVNKLKDYIKEANDRINAELSYAAEIQRSALPSVFPPFPDFEKLFDIYASMDPAKEVGGDFYDFYIVGGTKLVFLVADVSGKGIPASLFMMRSKTILKSYAEYGVAVNDIFTNANYNLCEGNDAGMFVTAWMGIYDLRTGHLSFANAGHNPPLIKRKDGSYEYLRTKAGFVLGGMEGIVYSELETDLMPGDEIYVYTDGVTEATDVNKELFGEDRLLTSINKHANEDAQTMCINIKADVDAFYDKAPQFDDITMLSLKIKDLMK